MGHKNHSSVDVVEDFMSDEQLVDCPRCSRPGSEREGAAGCYLCNCSVCKNKVALSIAVRYRLLTMLSEKEGYAHQISIQRHLESLAKR